MKIFIMLIIALAVVGVLLDIIISNNTFRIKRYQYNSHKLPASFDGFKIAHVSDLHNKRYGKNNAKLLKKIASLSPDIIVITGDIIHTEKHTNALSFVKGAVKLRPVYFVAGNHEFPLKIYPEFKQTMISLGVIVLENRTETISRDNEKIFISGIDDPFFFRNGKVTDIFADEPLTYPLACQQLKKENPNDFNVLLCHRPEYIADYSQADFDLVLCGHTHGGQVRLPFIGALYATNQSLFPPYAEGRHVYNDTTEFISRGLGSSTLIPKIFNYNELVLITLQANQTV